MTSVNTDTKPPSPVEITAPGPGVAVLACRCGVALALSDMCVLRYFTGPKIAPIVCRDCAEQAGARR